MTIACPNCQSVGSIIETRSISTAGIIAILAGVCLTPFIIGLALIPIGWMMKDTHHVCSQCGIRLD